MTAFAIASTDSHLDILALADAMEEKGFPELRQSVSSFCLCSRVGWKMERQQFPNSLHCTILPHHVTLVDKLLNDLRESAENVRVLNKKPAFVHHIKSYVFRGKKPRGEQRQFTAW